MLSDILIRNISASMLLFASATTALTQDIRRESLGLDQVNELRIVEGTITGRYLVESAAPRRPEMAEGGPIGNGVPFDATGSVPCAARAGEPAVLQVHSYFA